MELLLAVVAIIVFHIVWDRYFKSNEGIYYQEDEKESWRKKHLVMFSFKGVQGEALAHYMKEIPQIGHIISFEETQEDRVDYLGIDLKKKKFLVEHIQCIINREMPKKCQRDYRFHVCLKEVNNFSVSDYIKPQH